MMSDVYRALDGSIGSCGSRDCPLTVEISRSTAWHWGPFGGGYVRWGTQRFYVLAAPWFAFWIRRPMVQHGTEKDGGT